MRKKRIILAQFVSVVSSVALVACASSTTGSTSAKAASGSPILVGNITSIASPIFDFQPLVDGLNAAIQAVNKRGGIAGRPLKLIQCDDKADPNLDVSCAREMVNDHVVATLADNSPGNPVAVDQILGQAGISRILFAPTVPADFACTNVCFPAGTGNLGIVSAMGAVAAQQVAKKITLLYPDIPEGAQITGFIGQIITANGGQMVNKIPVGGTVTDYTSLVEAAQQNGAGAAILALGTSTADSVLAAAQQINSPLKFIASTGNFSISDFQQFPKVAPSIVMADHTPAPTASASTYPGLGEFRADMAASGNKNLAVNKLTTQPLAGWLAVHAFYQVMKDTDPKNITAATVLAAFSSAKNVDMRGIFLPWTPANNTDNPLLKRAWPYYYISRYRNGTIDTQPTEPFDLLAALTGSFKFVSSASPTMSSTSSTSSTS